jgi:predicted AlkP superfamily phosphohydrolase/phosphomutase
MIHKKVLVIGLDGYEVTLGDRMMAEGELPSLARLKAAGAHMRLDHGPAQRTGLAWEHVASGMSPEDARRWAAVSFDPSNYKVWQEGTSLIPFTRDLKARTVVFDAPYFDLRRTPNVQGVVNWGAHDPGVATNSAPGELLAEFTERFGNYGAKEFIYGLPWASPEACQRTGDALTKAVETRAEGCLWLLKERLPDWDLGFVVVSEPHSAIEALWHGVDATHPLHGLPSAAPAGEGLRSVYRAVDRLVGRLIDAFPDASVVVFSMGGMGPNRSDVVSMALLAELLYRNAFGTRLLRQRQDWVDAPNGLPMLKPGEDWALAVQELIPEYGSTPLPFRKQLRKNMLSLVPVSVKQSLRAFIDNLRNQAEHAESTQSDHLEPVRSGLFWMPATHYWPWWHAMPAFALPSFYDGRIRINLKGRERKGLVDPAQYRQVCDELEALLHECRDPVTGKGVVDFIERPAGSRDPRTLGPTECDLVVVWNGPLALDHPRLGRIGPIPYRRSGGHTGPYGMAYLVGSVLLPGDYGVRSSFDMVPTIIELLEERVPARISGASLLMK